VFDEKEGSATHGDLDVPAAKGRVVATVGLAKDI